MSTPAQFPGRLGLQQRVLPEYRVAFLDELAKRCADGLSVFAGRPKRGEAIVSADELRVASWERARNVDLFGGPLYLCLQPGIVAWLEREDPQALILEANPRYLSSQRAIDWMRARGRPVLGWGLGAPGWSPLRGRMLNRMDALIAYSSQGVEEYRALGVPAERIFVAPNAVTGPPGPLDRPPLDTGRPPRLLFVGRLQPRKRIDLLLRACAAVEQAPALSIVGDGPARVQLQELARRTYPAAEFHGALHGEPLRQQYRAAELFVLPGTGGLAVQQALAHGLPVIVAEADGSAVDLVTPENGWRVAPGSLAELTAALEQALGDRQRLRQMGEQSHRIARERANIEVMADAFVRALEWAARR